MAIYMKVVNEKWAYFYRNCLDANAHEPILIHHTDCLSISDASIAWVPGLVEQLVARFMCRLLTDAG